MTASSSSNSNYLILLLRIAFTHTLHAAHTIIMIIIAIAGVVAICVPKVKEYIDIDERLLTAFTILSVLVVRLVLAPYWIYKLQNSELAEKTAQLDRISEDRPLAYETVNFSVTGNNFHTTPTYAINHLELVFNNLSDRMLKYTVVELYIEYLGSKIVVPTDLEAGTFIHARQTMSYGFDVQGMNVTQFPATFCIGFKVHYDNVPSLRRRSTRRVIDYKFLSFKPMNWTNLIREQEED